MGLGLATAVGALPAIAGLLLHALPAYVTQHVARRFDPTRVALMRIGAGWVSFTLWYAAMTLFAVTLLHGWAALVVPLAAAALGSWALAWSDGWRELRARLRWLLAERREPRRMSRLRREEETLLRLFHDAERGPDARATEEVTR